MVEVVHTYFKLTLLKTLLSHLFPLSLKLSWVRVQADMVEVVHTYFKLTLLKTLLSHLFPLSLKLSVGKSPGRYG